MTQTTVRQTWVIGGAIAIIGLMFMLTTGVQILQAVVLTLIVSTQVAAGTWFWTRVRQGTTTAVESLGMGSAIGVISALLLGLCVQRLGLGHWGWILPAVAAAIDWSLQRRWRKPALMNPSTAKIESATLWALVVTAIAGLVSLVPNIISYPLSWAGSGGKYHPDMLFFEALSTSLTKFGAQGSIFSPGESIHYHWLVYAWTGQIAETANADPFVALTRVLPFLAIASSCLLAIAWVKRLTSVPWAPTLAVVLLIFGGYIGATYGAIFNFDSPSQSLTAGWILAFGYGLVVVLNNTSGGIKSSLGEFTIIALIMFGLSGGKISSGAIALAALLFTTLIAVLRKEPWAKFALIASVLSTCVFIATYIVVVSGSADPGGLKFLSILNRASSVQGLNPVSGNFGIVLGTAILVLAIVARWAGLAWFWSSPKMRWDPSIVFGTGLVIGAVIALLVLSSGLNETWFALAASAPLAAISAAGVAEAAKDLSIDQFKNSKALLIVLLCAAFVFFLVGGLWLTGASGGNVWVGTSRWLAPILGVLVTLVFAFFLAKSKHSPLSVARSFLGYSIIILVLVSAPGRLLGFGSGQVGAQPGLSNEAFGPLIPFVESIDQAGSLAWSDNDVAAAKWLQVHAQDNELVATNITLGAFVPALTQLPTFVSAMSYQGIYGAPQMVQSLIDREAESWNFINSPSVQTVSPLCTAQVTWVWVDPKRTGQREWAPYALKAFENDAVTLLKLNSKYCAGQ